uniref:Uncharacterized protein n=1 Tax=Tanacetum cinerariifolium TaxID=118510 RepID=A0A6L2M5X8_TANCI|nr:hypothetical protein [Tanacetum cinerariifolium]
MVASKNDDVYRLQQVSERSGSVPFMCCSRCNTSKPVSKYLNYEKAIRMNTTYCKYKWIRHIEVNEYGVLDGKHWTMVDDVIDKLRLDSRFWVWWFNTTYPSIEYVILKVYGGYGVSIFLDMAYRSLEVGLIRRIQVLDTAYWGFLGVGTTLDIFQNIILIPYLEYGILSISGYDVLILIPVWSLVSAGTDTPYLP